MSGVRLVRIVIIVSSSGSHVPIAMTIRRNLIPMSANDVVRRKYFAVAERVADRGNDRRLSLAQELTIQPNVVKLNAL